MQSSPNYLWVCSKCGYQIAGHQDNHVVVLLPPKCPNCETAMDGGPVVHQGPLDNDNKCY